LTIPVAIAIPQEGDSSSTDTGSGDSGTPSTRTYTVKSGDTLSAIAVKFSSTVAAIASANNITNINNIKVGQVLIIP
jgi:LysM repeat protein